MLLVSGSCQKTIFSVSRLETDNQNAHLNRHLLTKGLSMEYTKVTEDQFEITDHGIKHVPTGCEFTCHLGSPYSGTRREGHRGSKLPDGQDFDVSQLDAMMERLWGEHVKKRGL